MIDRNAAADAPGPAGVLVAVDGSAPALGAARWAGLYAHLHGAPLKIGCAVQLPVPTGAAGATRIDFLDALRRRSRRALDRAEDAARGVMGDGAAVSSEMWDGPAIPAILDAARSAGVVVLGDSGLGESPQAAAGSVATALTAYGERPVIVVTGWRGEEEALETGPVVVGVDGSSHSERALTFALDEARARGADLLAVHAFSDVPLAGTGLLDGPDGDGGAGGEGGEYGEGGRALSEIVAEYEDVVLAEALAGRAQDYPDVTIRRSVARDRPVRHLLQAAQGAAMLVVGCRGRGGFTGMMVGSTSRALLHSATCPLAVVRDPDENEAERER